MTVTSPEPSWNLSPLPWPTAGPTWTPSGVCDSSSTGRATASFKAPPNSALLLSAPNSRTGPDGVGADIRIIGAAVATPGTAATSAVIASGNPASVMPDTSSAAMPGDPVGQPVDRSGDRPEDAEHRDQIHCGHGHYGDRGDRAPAMHSELSQAEQAEPARRGSDRRTGSHPGTTDISSEPSRPSCSVITRSVAAAASELWVTITTSRPRPSS